MALRSFKLSSKLPFRRRPIHSIAGDSPAELSIPSHFLCPISIDLMKDPVILPSGITFDRSSIETWLQAGNFTCPVTKNPLFAADLIPNHTLRRLIQAWCVANRSLGIERIPTPKIPITSLQVSELLSEISDAHCRFNGDQCAELVAKLKMWASESDRNRRCITTNGAARVVSGVFEDFPSEQVLSALAGMLPFDKEARRKLVSDKSLRSIASVMRNGTLSGRLNAVLVVKEMVSTNNEDCGMIARNAELIEGIVKLIKEPISPQATKASLVAAYQLASADKRTASRFAEMGLVSVILEMIVDSERSFCEKGLALLDTILSAEAGRKMAAGNGLTMPVLVKKMLRVSNVATELAVSAAWKLCKRKGNGEGEENWLKEAGEVGAFQKLLLLLQVGCSDSTKEKASELLKMLNGFRGRMECIESVDFKGIKRSF
ncbi:U-box domain-containing protein 21-like [Phalaenopsis equestris]|uniref:U-box domain-containing protein 21-like n=1 Tax=Phalaenopsis equestris TaxID=78828 RepID=UPI0009E44050|nr:U-box domain-containing protein 21-like [Phalaenopsis equestris]